VIGVILSVPLFGFWLLVASRTIKGMWLGNLSQAPCLAMLAKA
jgi:hypothetical protein